MEKPHIKLMKSLDWHRSAGIWVAYFKSLPYGPFGMATSPKGAYRDLTRRFLWLPH